MTQTILSTKPKFLIVIHNNRQYFIVRQSIIFGKLIELIATQLTYSVAIHCKPITTFIIFCDGRHIVVWHACLCFPVDHLRNA